MKTLALIFALTASIASAQGTMFAQMFGQQATAWTPRSIADCALWLDASDASTLALSGTNVIVWADKSGNGNSATNGLSLSPSYVASFVNGRSALGFNGSNQRLFLTSSLSISNTTLFAVFNRAAGSIRTRIIGTVGNNATLSEWDSDNRVYNVFSGRVIYSGALTNTGVFVDSVTVSNAVNSSTLYRRNNAPLSLPSSTTYTSGITLTTIGYGDNQYNNGAILEIVYYNRKLSDDEIVLVENYLYGKWK